MAYACEVEWEQMPDYYCDTSTDLDYIGILKEQGYEVEVVDYNLDGLVAVVYSNSTDNYRCVNASASNRNIIFDAICNEQVKIGCGFFASCIDWATTGAPICTGVWALTNIALNKICD